MASPPETTASSVPASHSMNVTFSPSRGILIQGGYDLSSPSPSKSLELSPRVDPATGIPYQVFSIT
ncbi:hypothetical protein LB505_002629 [Fusarium chuoi]|nr:hypothetical protein LB505_002629 [Fusarium chuoi]